MAHFGRRGEHAPNAALTNAQAKEARRQYAAGAAKPADLARECGCSYSTMWRVLNHQTYLTPEHEDRWGS